MFHTSLKLRRTSKTVTILSLTLALTTSTSWASQETKDAKAVQAAQQSILVENQYGKKIILVTVFPSEERRTNPRMYSARIFQGQFAVKAGETAKKPLDSFDPQYPGLNIYECRDDQNGTAQELGFNHENPVTKATLQDFLAHKKKIVIAKKICEWTGEDTVSVKVVDLTTEQKEIKQAVATTDIFHPLAIIAACKTHAQSLSAIRDTIFIQNNSSDELHVRAGLTKLSIKPGLHAYSAQDVINVSQKETGTRDWELGKQDDRGFIHIKATRTCPITSTTALIELLCGTKKIVIEANGTVAIADHKEAKQAEQTTTGE